MHYCIVTTYSPVPNTIVKYLLFNIINYFNILFKVLKFYCFVDDVLIEQ